MNVPLTLAERRINGQQAGPHLLITAGVHGDEFEGMAAIRRLIHQLDPAEIRGAVSLIPVVNEAAYLRGSRAADDKLDLARTCPGKEDGSITERTAAALSERIREADFYIDLHSGGTAMSVWPLTGYMLHPDPKVLESQRAMARAFNLPVVWGTDYRLNGRSLSVARDAGVPAIYAEYLGSGGCAAEGVAAYVAGCMNVMAQCGMLVRARPASQILHEVEDRRQNSGHMQICNPAPWTGFFDPAVTLGQSVAAGDLLGTVSDVLGDDVAEIRTTIPGIVVVLRTFSRVLQDESLAVVLEIV
jgi:predicted deacylase